MILIFEMGIAYLNQIGVEYNDSFHSRRRKATDNYWFKESNVVACRLLISGAQIPQNGYHKGKCGKGLRSCIGRSSIEGEIAMIVENLKDHLDYVLHEILCMRKLLARCVSNLFTSDNSATGGHFITLSKAIWALSQEIPASFHERRRTMDPLVHTRGQGTVETVYLIRRICSEGYKEGWPAFSRIHKVDSTLTIWRRENGYTALLWRINEKTNCRESGPI